MGSQLESGVGKRLRDVDLRLLGPRTDSQLDNLN